MSPSIYYKQNFVSPQPLYAEVKEELSSYFLSGALDDIMFPKWTEHCLRRFRKSQYKIEDIVLELKDYTACLPTDFNSVRELWICSIFDGPLVQDAASNYYQTDCVIEPNYSQDGECPHGENCCDEYLVTHKVTRQFHFKFKTTHLLTPGNMHAKQFCGIESKNTNVSTEYTFDILNGYIVTNFPSGSLYLVYYAPATEEGEQLVPDDFWVQDYIRKFITYKLYKKLANIVTDETILQIERKMLKAEQEQAEAFVLAETELKKQTIYDKIRSIKNIYNQRKKYRL